VQRADLKAAGVGFTVRRHSLNFLAPNKPESPIAAWLKLRGPSPYAVTLQSSGQTGELDRSLTHGAALSFEDGGDGS
jgi:hypothetical protein